MRQIVLDTETTGLETREGHRIIEIGCVELLNRRLTGNNLHLYMNPEREIDAGAIEVHGITNEQLADKPRFADVADDVLSYLDGAELVIHNAPFDVGFLNSEFARLSHPEQFIESRCSITDTLALARRMHPGQRNSLDALCKRYAIDNSERVLHGALLDAEILADVYLLMTGGQVTLGLVQDHLDASSAQLNVDKMRAEGAVFVVPSATDDERAAHEAYLQQIAKVAGAAAQWP